VNVPRLKIAIFQLESFCEVRVVSYAYSAYALTCGWLIAAAGLLGTVQWVHITHRNQTDGRIRVGRRRADYVMFVHRGP